MKTLFTNLTCREEFRLTGSVTGERLSYLLDREDLLKCFSGVDVHINESFGGFPKEDFLEDIKNRLYGLRNNLRGNNKDTLNSIIESLDDLAQTTLYESEYSRSELNEALKIIKQSGIGQL